MKWLQLVGVRVKVATANTVKTTVDITNIAVVVVTTTTGTISIGTSS